jgi:hypothetical protein
MYAKDNRPNDAGNFKKAVHMYIAIEPANSYRDQHPPRIEASEEAPTSWRQEGEGILILSPETEFRADGKQLAG